MMRNTIQTCTLLHCLPSGGIQLKSFPIALGKRKKNDKACFIAIPQVKAQKVAKMPQSAVVWQQSLSFSSQVCNSNLG